MTNQRNVLYLKDNLKQKVVASASKATCQALAFTSRTIGFCLGLENAGLDPSHACRIRAGGSLRARLAGSRLSVRRRCWTTHKDSADHQASSLGGRQWRSRDTGGGGGASRWAVGTGTGYSDGQRVGGRGTGGDRSADRISIITIITAWGPGVLRATQRPPAIFTASQTHRQIRFNWVL